MLARLLTVPQDAQEWDEWAWHNADTLDQIRQAIGSAKGVTLPQRQLYPIPPGEDLQLWLANVQQSHNDFNGALGLQSSELEDVNLQDPADREAWVWANYQELQAACDTLRIGP